MLMELADYGSLRDAMDDHPLLLTSNVEVQLTLALHVAEGMAYLHAQDPPILHHDLKSANVLLFAAATTTSTADAANAALTARSPGGITARSPGKYSARNYGGNFSARSPGSGKFSARSPAGNLSATTTFRAGSSGLDERSIAGPEASGAAPPS